MSQPFLEPILPVEVASGWYLRGDIGYSINNTPDGSRNSAASGTLNYFNENLDNSLVAGFGAGYKFNPWFRTDLTADYNANANFTGNVACFVACGVPPYSSESGRISSWAVLANAYFDLGTWSGFTPYVGAGVGAANVRLSNYLGHNPPFFFPIARVGANTSTWNFAWAAMAGASIDLTPNWLLDFNYRYLSVGDVNTVDQFGGQINIDDITSHQFRVGVRFLID